MSLAWTVKNNNVQMTIKNFVLLNILLILNIVCSLLYYLLFCFLIRNSSER